MSELAESQIISEPQMNFLQERGKNIANELTTGNFDAAVYLDRSARPLLQFVRQGLKESGAQFDIRNYFLSIGADQVRGYLKHIYRMKNSKDTRTQNEYYARFGELDSYMSNLFVVEGLDPENQFPKTRAPRLERQHLNSQTIHEFFNEEDIAKIQESIRKRARELNTHELKIAVIDDLKGSGISIQFACALLELLASEIGVTLTTERLTFLDYYNLDPNSSIFTTEGETKPYMPWKERKDEEGRIVKSGSSFVDEKEDNRLIASSMYRVAEDASTEEQRQTALISIARAKRLYEEIWRRVRSPKVEDI